MNTRLKQIIVKSVLIRCMKILQKNDQIKLVLMSVIQLFLGLLDLIGVAAIGALGSLAVNGIQSREPGGRVSSLLSSLRMENLTVQSQVAILAVFATAMLVGRTLLSIYFTRRTLFFLGRRGAALSSGLISKLLSHSYVAINSRSSQETLYATTRGVEIVTLGVLGTFATIASDLSALTLLSLGLFIIDPTIAFLTFTVFAFVGLILYRLLHLKARLLGASNARLVIEGNDMILQVMGNYREALVHNRREYYAKEISKIREELADTLSELNFMPNVSKYVIETTVLIGALLIAGIQFLLQDATQATATLAIFLASGTRIAPAVLRIQQGSLLIKSNLAQASMTLDMLEELNAVKTLPISPLKISFDHHGFQADVKMVDVVFTYRENTKPTIACLSLSLTEGSSLALVGPSGGGKTTILDVLLGVLTPDSGSVMISNKSPLECFEIWPGAISYVPQDVQIIQGTIRQNVALGYPIELASDDLIWAALEVAQLSNYVRGLPKGIDSEVGERGLKLSGGQRQRLGVARGMFTKPKLLILDEATSSLDGETEAEISRAIEDLRGSVTIISIAHRLSTVRHADKVVYVENGKVVAEGTFLQVRRSVPNFDNQAKLMGL